MTVGPLTTTTAGAFVQGAGLSKQKGTGQMAKVKIMTTRGVGIQGVHYEPNIILEVEEDIAGQVVACNGALFVVNEKLAQAEAERRQAEAAEKNPKAETGKKAPR